MKLIPEYAENIIVAVIHNGNLSWYVTDKEIWYMDYKKRINKFEENGYHINIDFIDDSRKGLLILDEDTVDIFAQRLIEFKVSTNELKQFLEKEKEESEEWFYKLSPSLYINFDKKILYSAYREMEDYENYIPDGWSGEYGEFLEKIPLRECYWKDGTNINYFQ